MPWGLFGQERALAAITEMLRSGRIPHAIMLYGPAGSGKFTMAMAVAKALNCENP